MKIIKFQVEGEKSQRGYKGTYWTKCVQNFQGKTNLIWFAMQLMMIKIKLV